jgi:hypothetical protein
MNKKKRERIFIKCKEEINRRLKSNHYFSLPEKEAMKRCARLYKMLGKEKYYKVWLGGPGPEDPLHWKRRLCGDILKTRSFLIIFSEDYEYADPESIPIREKTQARESDLVIIINTSQGPLTEATTFAEEEEIKEKTFVFIPEKYLMGEGYAVLELKNRYPSSQLKRFDLKKFELCDTELFIQIWYHAETFRVNEMGNRKLEDKIKELL